MHTGPYRNIRSVCTGTQTHTHTHKHTHTHSLHHADRERTEGDGGRTSMHGCQIQAKRSWRCVFVCVHSADVCVCVCVCVKAQVHEAWSLGVCRKLFFPDALKEQPSLMDYFQLRTEVSHLACIVTTNCVAAAENLLLHRVCDPPLI